MRLPKQGQLCIAMLMVLAACGSAAVHAAVLPLPANNGGDDDHEIGFQAMMVQEDCVMGNVNDPVSSYNPGADVVYMFDPLELGCPCSYGFKVRSISVVLEYLGPLPIDVRVYAGLIDDVVRHTESCWTPTQYAIYGCGAYLDVSMTSPGYHLIEIQMECECAYMDYNGDPLRYALWFLGEGGNIAVDDDPVLCRSLERIYLGHLTNWFDICGLGGHDPPAPGNLIIWANVDCCEPPVEASDSSWGQLKALYR